MITTHPTLQAADLQCRVPTQCTPMAGTVIYGISKAKHHPVRVVDGQVRKAFAQLLQANVKLRMCRVRWSIYYRWHKHWQYL